MHRYKTSLQTDTITLQTDTVTLQTDTVTLQTDTVALQTDTVTLQHCKVTLQTYTTTLQTCKASLQTDTTTLQRCKATLQTDTVTVQQHTEVNLSGIWTDSEENWTLVEVRKGKCGTRIQSMATQINSDAFPKFCNLVASNCCCGGVFQGQGNF